MKIVRLSQDEYRKWRENPPCLIDAEGIALRALTFDEVNVFRDLDKHALAAKRTISAIVDEGTESVRTLEVVVKLDAKGGHTLERNINGGTVVPLRDAIMNALAKIHGERFQIRTPGGKFPLKTKRGAAMGGGGGGAVVAGGVPHPEACQCKGYAGRQEGRHHKICQYNNAAPIDQRAIEDGVVVQQAAPSIQVPGQGVTMSGGGAPVSQAGPRVRFLPSTAPTQTGPQGGAPVRPPAVPGFMMAAQILPSTQVVPTPAVSPTPPGAPAAPPILTQPVILAQGVTVPNAPVAPVAQLAAPAAPPAAPQPPPIVSPAECPNQCCKWFGHPTGKPDVHHATCLNREPWELQQKGIEPKVLVDLDTKQLLREATPEEVAEATANMGVAKVDDKAYGVVPRSEAFAPPPGGLTAPPVSAEAAPAE